MIKAACPERGASSDGRVGDTMTTITRAREIPWGARVMFWLRDLERYYVLPLRFLRAHWRDCRQQRQKCKVCGQADGFDFHVPDEIWEAAVPARWRKRVVCLRCFDAFARQRGVDYSQSLQALCFVGEQEAIELQVVRR